MLPGPLPCRRSRARRALFAPAAGAIAAAALAVTFVLPARAQDEVAIYGDAGTTELSVHLGFGSNFFSAGGGARYFVIDGLAPGIEGSYQRNYGRGQGLVAGSLRVAPLRFGAIVPVLTARAGRLFISDHPSGWAVGGDAGVIIVLGRHIALEVGYGFLRLLPASFCADFVSCTISQPVFGLRVTF